MADINHTDRAHALLSASGASRWMGCTPSARLEEKMPEQSSVFAQEGTVAHEIADLKLQLLLTNDPEDLVSILEQTTEQREHDLYKDEMEDCTDRYVDYVQELHTEALTRDTEALLVPEMKVDYSAFAADGFGTCDAIVIGGHVLDLVDYKHGMGIPVPAKNNPQLKLYGVGALNEFLFMYPDITVVRLHIFQPRLDNISTWEISVEELLLWANNEVQPKAALAHAGEGEQIPGDWCRFCKVQPVCEALRNEALEVAQDDFKDAGLVSDTDLLGMFNKADRIGKYLNAVKAHMLEQARNGKRWGGLKMVAGRANRKIADEDTAARKMRNAKFRKDDYMRTSLKPIGELEKLMGKDRFAKVLKDVVIKPEGKPTLVPESDKRQAINHAADFDD